MKADHCLHQALDESLRAANSVERSTFCSRGVGGDAIQVKLPRSNGGAEFCKKYGFCHVSGTDQVDSLAVRDSSEPKNFCSRDAPALPTLFVPDSNHYDTTAVYGLNLPRHVSTTTWSTGTPNCRPPYRTNSDCQRCPSGRRGSRNVE